MSDSIENRIEHFFLLWPPFGPAELNDLYYRENPAFILFITSFDLKEFSLIFLYRNEYGTLTENPACITSFGPAGFILLLFHNLNKSVISIENGVVLPSVTSFGPALFLLLIFLNKCVIVLENPTFITSITTVVQWVLFYWSCFKWRISH